MRLLPLTGTNAGFSWRAAWRTVLAFIILSLLLGVVGCGGQKEPETVRLALLPILDALPMYVAEEQGYFEEENLTVEFIPVTSAAERDQVIVTDNPPPAFIFAPAVFRAAVVIPGIEFESTVDILGRDIFIDYQIIQSPPSRLVPGQIIVSGKYSK